MTSDIYQDHATLTVVEEVDDGVCVCSSDKDECVFRMPISSHDSRIAVIVRRGDSFVFRKGRWSVQLEACSPASSTRTTSRQTCSETIAAAAAAYTMTTTSAEPEEPADSGRVDATPPQPRPIPYKTVVEHVNPATAPTNLVESQESIGAEDRLQSAINIASGANPDLDYTVPKSHPDVTGVHGIEFSLTVHNSTAEPSTCLQDEATVEHSGRKSKVTEVDDTSETPKTVSVISRNPRITKFSDFETRISPIPSPVAESPTEKAEKKSESKQRLTSGVKRKKSSSADQAVSDEDIPEPESGNNSKSTMKRSRTKRIAAQSSPVDSTRSHTSSALTPKSSNTPSRTRSASLKTYQGPPPRIIFSSTTKVDSNRAVMQSFGSFGGQIAKEFEKANILCMGKPPLKKTLKFVLSIALAKDIVTEDWLFQSHKKKGLLDHEEFLPADPTREGKWKFCLKDAVERGKAGQLSGLLDGARVYFTRQLKIELDQCYADFKSLLKFIGGRAMGVQMPKPTDSWGEIMVIGVENDPQIAFVGKLGRTLYKKDVVVMAVLRGKLELDSEEFHVEVPVKEEEAGEDVEP